MKKFLLLTISGRDRTGIVAALTRSLFEAGCHLEDSTMTRLRGELVIMMLLRQPANLPREALALLLNAMANDMGLTWSVREVSPSVAPHPESSPEIQPCLIRVQGANQPGIVYRTTAALAKLAGNITNLRTHISQSSEESIYTMTIEAEIAIDRYTPLQSSLAELAQELHMEITVQKSAPYAHRHPAAGSDKHVPCPARDVGCLVG